MYERRNEKLLPLEDFRSRVVRAGLVVAAAVTVALSIGVAGYHWLANLPWVDALLNASMILGGMGPVDKVTSTSAKLFASFYALFSGLFIIAASSIVLAPFLHRFLHRFHLEKKGQDE